jgi:hypothetical protein
MASVTWSGIEQVKANLTQLRQRMHDGAREAGGEQARKILTAAQSNAPVLTGELVASGTTEEISVGMFRVIFTAGHAAVVERRHPSQAEYLRRAVEGNRTEQGYADKLATKLR